MREKIEIIFGLPKWLMIWTEDFAWLDHLQQSLNGHIKMITNRLIYSFLCAISLLAMTYFVFFTAGMNFAMENCVAPVIIGLLGGFFIGLMKDRWTMINIKLEQIVNSRTNELRGKTQELEATRKRLLLLKGLLPVCSFCKNIQDNSGDWSEIEEYLLNHSETDFSQRLCPTCTQKFPPRTEKVRR